MVAQASCPGRERLQRLLDGRLPGPDQEALVAHLDGCPNCQRGIEELAAGREAWAATARYLRDGQPEPERALRQLLETPGRVDTDMNAEPNDAEVPLDFLGPTDRPGMIGRFGRYDVAGVIGRGGMGIVLKALDPCLQRTVAVKVLDPLLARNELARQRFCREARAAAAVTHENVVAVHEVDIDKEKDLPYIVMQYVAGVTLQDRLDRGDRLPLREVIRIGQQTAAGLAAAHAQGLVHRDIKPGNILLETNGERGHSGPWLRVKLTDFGLARAAEDAKLTQTGFVAGTPLYMAPEQAREEPVDGRTDLFSLGGVLYALCTGRPPF